MDDFKKELFCANCESVKENKFCDNCQQETPDFIKLDIHTTVEARGSLGIKQKRPGFKDFVKKIFSGFQPSGDKRLPNGVDVQLIADREKDEWHHIVRDYKTKKILHEEHELLSKHKQHKK